MTDARSRRDKQKAPQDLRGLDRFYCFGIKPCGDGGTSRRLQPRARTGTRWQVQEWEQGVTLISVKYTPPTAPLLVFSMSPSRK